MPNTTKRQHRTIASFLETSRQHLGLLGSLLIAGGIGAALAGPAMADEEPEARPNMERRVESLGPPARLPIERMP